MTNEALAEIEKRADTVVRSSLLGVNLTHAYNLASVDVPLLVAAVRHLSMANVKLREALKAAKEGKR